MEVSEVNGGGVSFCHRENVEAGPGERDSVLIVERSMDVPNLVEVDATSVSVEWTPVPITVHSKRIRVVEYLMSFSLQMQQVSSAFDVKKINVGENRWTTQYSGPATHVQVKGLHPGRTYALRVLCRPEVKDPNVVLQLAPPSEVLVIRTKATSPSVMLPPMLASRERSSLKLKWSEPEEDGGHAILEYVLEGTLPFEEPSLAPNSQGMFEIYRGPEKTYTWKKLSPGVRYSARAVNCVGEGAFSSIASFMTQASVPNQPSQPAVVSSTANSVTLEWPPISGNGSEILSYTLELDEGSQGYEFVAKVQERTVTLSNLRNGVPYKVRVCAENSEGCSAFGPELVFQTSIIQPPTAPEILKYFVSEVSVKFLVHSICENGTNIHIFELSETKSDEFSAKNWREKFRGQADAYEIQGLKPGTYYAARVKALNSFGESDYSKIIYFRTKLALCCPRDLHVSEQAKGSQAFWLLTWKSPCDCCGELTYFVEYMKVAAYGASECKFEPLYCGDELCCEVGNLERGKKYIFRIHTANSLGQQSSPEELEFETSEMLPGSPEDIVVENISSNGFLLSWDHQMYKDLQFVVQIVEVSEGSCDPDLGPSSENMHFKTLYHGSDRSFQVMGLQPLRKYFARIKAENSSGDGPWAESGIIQTNSAPPTSPGLELCDAGTDFLTFLLKHESLPGDPVSSSLVEYVEEDAIMNSGPSWNKCYEGHECRFKVSGLLPGKNYLFRAKCRNTAGWGSWNDTSTFNTKADAPDPPETPRVVAKGGNSFKISWNIPKSNGAPVLEFELALRKNLCTEEIEIIYRGPDSCCRASDLDFGTQYDFMVRAYNTVGSSLWSQVCSKMTLLRPPPPPENLKTTINGMQATFSWDKPVRSFEEAECIGYELEICHRQKQRKLSNSKSMKLNPERKDIMVLKKTLRASDLMFNWSISNISGEMMIRIRSIGGGGSGHGIWSEYSPLVLVDRHVDSTKLLETTATPQRDVTMLPEATDERYVCASQGTNLPRSRQIPAMKTAIAKKRKPKTWVSLLAQATGINESSIIVSAVIILVTVAVWMFTFYVM